MARVGDGALGLGAERFELYRVVRERADDPHDEGVVVLEGVLVDEDVAYDDTGIALRQVWLAAQRVIEQRRQVAVVARVGFDVPQRVDDLLHVVARVEAQALAIDRQPRAVFHLFRFHRRHVEEQPARPACREQFAQRLVERHADAARRLARIAGEVLQVAVVEVGEVVDEGEASYAVAGVGREQQDRVKTELAAVEQHVGDPVDRIGLVGKRRPEKVAGVGKAAPVNLGDELEKPAETDHSVVNPSPCEPGAPCIANAPVTQKRRLSVCGTGSKFARSNDRPAG